MKNKMETQDKIKCIRCSKKLIDESEIKYNCCFDCQLKNLLTGLNNISNKE